MTPLPPLPEPSLIGGIANLRSGMYPSEQDGDIAFDD